MLINFNQPGVGLECQICALKPAPVQILSSNSPGTSGAYYYNYLMADKVSIPQELFGLYSEQII